MLTALLVTAAEEPSDWSSNKLVLAAVAALLGFLSGFALEVVKKRRGSRTQLSWSLRIEEPKLSHGRNDSDAVKISYRGQEVDRLVSVHCVLENTGTTAIKNQYVRFKVPAEAKMLQRDLDPKPEPEMGVRDVTDADLEFAGPRYRIEHLDPRESVSFLFAADGGNWRDWDAIVFRNETADVTYQRRDVTQNRDEQEHVASFLFAITATLIVALMTAAASLSLWIMSRFWLSEIGYIITVVAVTVLLAAAGAFLISKARRATRSIVQLWTGTDRQPSIMATGGGSWVAYAPAGIVTVNRAEE